MKSKLQEIPILIVGAGSVGLSMGLALSRLGIKSLIVERNTEFMNHPKARGVNVRTMEIFRQWGIIHEILKYELPKDARSITWLNTLQEDEISRVTMDDSLVSQYSPAKASFVAQDNVEKVLYDALLTYDKSDVLFSNELISFEEDHSGVIGKIYNHKTNEEEYIRAQYLIAADGAHSRVRKQLDIKMDGNDNLGTFCSVYCEFDILKWTKHRPSFGYFFANPKFQGKYLVTVDGVKKWIAVLAMNKSENKEQYTDSYCKKQIHDLIGESDLPINIISTGFWTMAAQVASQYKIGRTFLVGDAAHRMPPAGGFGMNTGIQDAHNLAWKLAMVLNKSMDESLLDTYYEERGPVAQQNITWSLKNASRYGEIWAAIHANNHELLKLKLEEQSKNLNYIGLDIGFKYNSNAVLRESSDKLNDEILVDTYLPNTAPGARAPHVELTYNDRIISTLDLFENFFVFFVGKEGDLWTIAANEISKQMKFPVIIYQIHDSTNFVVSKSNDGIINLVDHQNMWHKIYEITTTGAVLVRPDGHVAWRANARSHNTKVIVSKVFKIIQQLS